MEKEKETIISGAINTINADDIKAFAWMLAEDLPEYIWHVGASSTGKYHPAYSLGEGGLMRHMIATLTFLNHMIGLVQYAIGERERDLMRVAALFHDGLKSGTQEEYEESKFTKHEHPMLMGKHIMSYEGKCGLDKGDLAFIANCIASHMGQWNTSSRSDEVLPKPVTMYQQLIHLADFLASRKDLEVHF